MLLLSKMTGQDVRGSDGVVFGRVADLSTRLDDHVDLHLVERILVKRRRGPDLLLPWAVIESFEPTGVLIHGGHDPTTFAFTSTVDALGDDEILLMRDVLDTQIVDVVGQRMARVADVVLTRCVFGALVVLSPNAPLVTILVATQVLNAVLLLPLLVVMVGIGRDRDLMGRFTIGLSATIAYWTTTAVVAACVAALAITSLRG